MSLDKIVRETRQSLNRIKRSYGTAFNVGYGRAVDREIRRGPIEYIADLVYNKVRGRDNTNIADAFYDRFGDDEEIGHHLHNPDVAKSVRALSKDQDTIELWNARDMDGTQRPAWHRKFERYSSLLQTGLVVGAFAFPGITAAVFGSTALGLSLLFPIGLAKLGVGWYHDVKRGGDEYTKLKHMALTTAKEGIQAFYPLITPLGIPIPTSAYGIWRSYSREHSTASQEEALQNMKTQLKQEIPNLYPAPRAAPQPAGPPQGVPRGMPAPQYA